MAATGFMTSPTYLAAPSSQQTSAASSTSSAPRVFFAIRRHVSHWKNVKGGDLRKAARQWRAGAIVAMAPDDEKMTRRSPLDFPVEWDRPSPGRRPDIFPQFSPMKTPLPPPLPTDPPEEDEDEDDEKKEDDPDKEDKPEE